MRYVRTLALALGGLVLTGHAQAAENFLAGIPRNQVLIAENPEGTVADPSNFNVWVPKPNGTSTGLQQLCMDTLWYIDPDQGLNGQVWDNSLAADKPKYNSDFTEMTVKLRSGIAWSDGVEFTADDVVYTVQTLMADAGGFNDGARMAANVDTVAAPDKTTVVFKLKKPNSRFHAAFTVRWSATWIMPKHVFEKQAKPSKYDFNPPVCLGSYTLKSFDPNGTWFIWQKRADWQKTTLARFGEPGPNYVAYIDPGPPDKRVILQQNHQLDIVHDTSPEGAFALIKSSPTSHGWFKGFPYAHPDPTLPMIVLNNQLPKFSNPDVRWALALLIDIKAVDMASYRGAATISAIPVPPTGTYPHYYFEPMESWLKDFTIDTGKQTIHPYDPNMGQEIADMLRPSMGDAIPKDPKAIAAAFGHGWWKQDPQAAAELLAKAGLKKVGGKWMLPDGTPFTITISTEGDNRPVMTPRRQHHRPAVDAGGHRFQDRRLADRHVEQHVQWSERSDDGVDGGDLGRPSRPVVLPRLLALAVLGRAGQVPAAAQLAALERPRARQDHREDSLDRLRRSQGHRAWSGLHQAVCEEHAQHPADVL